MVRLLPKSLSIAELEELSFNPTMVRLLLEPRKVRWSASLEFQSHNGAIAADVYAQGGALNISFQSHNGAIAAMESNQQVTTTRNVSIPQWCDCCQFAAAFPIVDVFVSIPQWCDCCRLTC